ncbi:MAG: SpoIIE family protein phosphatase [Deltaproteobacteria bacterium]|nr:SpoIIE family protein phosphatase [Deltaproteobacteria bacterium]
MERAAATANATAMIPLRHRFVVRVALGFLLCVLVPSAVVGWVSYETAKRVLVQELKRRLITVAERKVNKLEDWTDQQRRVLAAIVREPALQQQMDELTRAQDQDQRRRRASGLLLGMASQLRLLGRGSALLVDANGQVLATSGDSNLAGQSLSRGLLARSELGQSFDRARMVYQTEFTDFALATDQGDRREPRAWLAAPILATGQVVGVLVVQIDNDAVSRLSADHAGLGSSGEVLYAGRVGSLPMLIAPTRTHANAAFRLQIPSHSAAIDALRGSSGDGLRRDYRGVDVFAVWRYVPSLRWGVVCKIDVHEVFAPVERLRLLSIGITALAAALSLLAAWVFGRRLSSPLETMTREVVAIGQGNREQGVSAQGHDEVAHLARVFNAMLDEIRAHTEGLEGQVAERTRALAEANEELQVRGRRIEEGVALARQIQATVLPSFTGERAEVGGLIWRPLDQVGGDIAFVEPLGEDGYVAGVIDCTGHGVPAAITAMFASAMCQLALITHGSQGPAAVLHELDRRLTSTFRRANEAGISLGLDVGLAMVSRDGPVRFAGAGIQIFYARSDGSISEKAGRRRGLGYGERKREVAITDVLLSEEDITTLYLSTDGMLDEPIGQSGEGLGRSKLFALLSGLQSMSIAAQLETLDAQVIALRGARTQRDDVTVLAMRVGPNSSNRQVA